MEKRMNYHRDFAIGRRPLIDGAKRSFLAADNTDAKIFMILFFSPHFLDPILSREWLINKKKPHSFFKQNNTNA